MDTVERGAIAREKEERRRKGDDDDVEKIAASVGGAERKSLTGTYITFTSK